LAAISQCGKISVTVEEAGLLSEPHRHGVSVAVARPVPDANGETDLRPMGGLVMSEPIADRRPLVGPPGEREAVPGKKYAAVRGSPGTAARALLRTVC
jgi:hypothetical protein